MPELSKKRPRPALLGVFAIAASVLAVGASPASAEPGRADAAATYSACVGPAAADAGFTDVAAGSTHDAAINCIAYYGITRGTTATTFSPDQTIPRWQLAVMLQRAAGPAGVDLPAARDMGFTDISGLGSLFRDAVNQMAALGVMAGTTTTTFDPSGIVSRATIVEALAGFLTNARVGPGGKALSRSVNRSLTLRESTASNAAAISIDESFRDVGGVTYSAYQSIHALAEMGVVQGRRDGTFGPAASVTRGQAASFITRALAHTNTRPAGLTMQLDKAATSADADLLLAVSVRGNDFSPIESASVDVFSYTAKNAATAFRTDGTCNTGSAGVSAAAGGTAACLIEIGDEVTEPSGNVEIDLDQVASGRVFWAWTGAVGDRLDWDDNSNLSLDGSVVSNAASVAVSTVAVPSSAKVTTSVSADAKDKNTVRYGTTVTVTIQLIDGAGQPIGVAGQSYIWSATGLHAPTGPARIIPGTGARTVTTDSTGKAAFTIAQSDPDTNAAADGPDEDPGADDSTTWTYNIRRVGAAAVPAANPGIGFTVTDGNGRGAVVFEDDRSTAQAVKIELQRPWTVRPAAGAAGRVGVTGKVTDQYGAPMRGHPVFFDLDGNGAFGCQTLAADGSCQTVGSGDATISGTGARSRIQGTITRLTRSSGANTVGAVFTASSATAGSAYVYRAAADINGDNDVADSGEIATATHYWAYNPVGWDSDTGIAPIATSSSNDNGHLRRIRLVDYDNNAILRDTKMPGDAWSPLKVGAWRYGDNDIFRWYVDNGSGGPDSQGERWLTVDEFEARMARHMAQGGQAGGTTAYPSFHSSGIEVQASQYQTANGFSGFRIQLKAGDNIADPPAP